MCSAVRKGGLKTTADEAMPTSIRGGSIVKVEGQGEKKLIEISEDKEGKTSNNGGGEQREREN